MINAVPVNLKYYFTSPSTRHLRMTFLDNSLAFVGTELARSALFGSYAGNVLPFVSCPKGNNSNPITNAAAVYDTGLPIV
jgi:hypothetical protein